ncbi:MAG: phosphomannomutase/phosphoglucomutase [Alphaproteobacteria bacterium]
MIDSPSPTIFRDYDIRGRIGFDLDSQVAFYVGRSFGTVLRRSSGKTVCVARDGRLSSPDLEQGLIRGLRESGINVLSVGLGPTPFLYWAERHAKADAGVMVTGSHNPSDENGFKFTFHGQPFFGEQVQRLLKLIEAEDFIENQTEGRFEVLDLLKSYRFDLLDRLAWGDEPLSVAWDPGNGAAGIVLSEIIAELPGAHHLIHGSVDGRFLSRSPDPMAPGSLDALRDLVQKEKCRVGVAFDGDADRLVIIDEQGAVWAGDEVLAFFVFNLLNSRSSLTFVQDVKCSPILSNWLKNLNATPSLSKTGHVHVKACMKKNGALVGGEMSGHFFFTDLHPGYDDGIYAALRFLAFLSRHQIDLSVWRQKLPFRYSTPEIRLPCAEDKKFQLIEKIQAHFQETGVAFQDLDGIRVEDEGGWWILRASQTQACIAMRCEASTPEGLEARKNILETLLKSHGLECIWPV